MGVCILIVDDDRLVVEKLMNGINWARLGITDVLSANNIRQAMEILEEVPVDIFLSDIEMPQGNGLELLEWVRDKQMPLECIFLSSYALFAYAQKAIRLNSCGYLLKPVSNREMVLIFIYLDLHAQDLIIVLAIKHFLDQIMIACLAKLWLRLFQCKLALLLITLEIIGLGSLVVCHATRNIILDILSTLH